jgi:multidrug efflux pump subunit AcrB
MPSDEMERRIVTPYERILTTTVDDIEHIESQSLAGISVVKIYFHPGNSIPRAIAQVTAVSQTAIRAMPPGIQPPLVIQYSASEVPILQLSIESDTLSEQQIYDYAVNFLRPQLVTIPGVQVPYPYGGKQRQVMVDIDPEKLFALGVSAADVSAAVNAQNLTLPAGTAKIGAQEYQVRLNSSTETVEALNDLPIKSVNGTTVYIRDVAHVRDGFTVQTNVVNTNGKRGVLVSILKAGDASTLDVVAGVRAALPKIEKSLPPELKITPLFDQAVFVRASVLGVIKEAVIAAGLTALMILVFLGSWRSTLIVAISIPLSILVSIIVLSSLGQTLNTMTLGGMALAVGILVDDATVELENVHRNLHQRKRLVQAILDGASQIAVPAFVATICICIVFVPVVFIAGAAKYLFTPLAMSVVFAMFTSYLLSRTLVPTMVHYLLASEVTMYGGVVDPHDPREKNVKPEAAGAKRNIIWRMHDAFNRKFEVLRRSYGGLLQWTLSRSRLFIAGFLLLVAASVTLIFPLIGTDFFPRVDAGQIRLHVRAPAGTRIEETERYFTKVEQVVRDIIPADQIDTVLNNIGIPNSGINLSLSDGTVMSSADGEILIALKPEHDATGKFVSRIRDSLHEKFPELTFFFSAPDIATQVLNFGLSAPVDIQVNGPITNSQANLEIAKKILAEVAVRPGVVDAHFQQVPTTPDLRVVVDRTMADQLGVTQASVAGDLLVSLSSSNQTAPNFWLNPSNGVNYGIYVQTPQFSIGSINDLQNTPVVPTMPGAISAAGNSGTQLLGNLAGIGRNSSATNITHYDISPTFDVLIDTQGADLGSVAKHVEDVVAKFEPQLPRGSTITLRGQVDSMKSSFTGLAYGVIFAVVLVYLIMAINFQSWVDPFIILMALPGAAAGILWMLWATHTTISVPALMGTIMSIGVATSNSILMITFANDQRKAGMNAFDAALSAGLTRLRPVMMTALAMIIGMLPMSLGLGDGGEQNAPLGRAVIGGLLAATVATLFFVPAVYSILRRRAPVTEIEEELR